MTLREQIINNIEYEDLSPDEQCVADVFGMEQLKEFIKIYGGFKFYIRDWKRHHEAIIPVIGSVLENTTFDKLAEELGLSKPFLIKLNKIHKERQEKDRK